MKIDLSRFIDRFKIETRDNLVAFDNALIKFEQSLNASSDVFDSGAAELTRIAHAIKGAARMLGFNGINNLCHSLEELVISIRVKGEANPEIIDLIVGARHGIENLLSLPPEATDAKGEPLPWLMDLHTRLRTAAEGKPLGEVSVQRDKTEEIGSAEPDGEDRKSSTPAPVIEQKNTWRDSTVRVDVDTIDDILLFGRELNQALSGINQIQRDVDKVKKRLENRIQQSLGSYGKIRLSVFEDMEIERDLGRISLHLKDGIAEVERHVRQIDNDAVELRMRHIEELYDKVPIQVRDLARSLKKDVSVSVSGGNVRLDGRIIDMLGESLLHIIRNSIDHGIESAEERDKNGKSEEGKLFISASENGGWVKIVIADDGCGIDPSAIRVRLVELGLVDESKIEKLSNDECLQYIFNDRFSMKKDASDISGRGVGLSAVKERLRELRGNITIESEVGIGTRFILTIPTSLSSQRILITSLYNADTGSLFYGIPTAMVKETSNRNLLEKTRIQEDKETPPDNGKTTISLSELLYNSRSADTTGNENYFVEVEDGIRSLILSVEQIVAETEAVIEPLPVIARSAELISGAAPITSDRIMLIINVPELISRFSQ